MAKHAFELKNRNYREEILLLFSTLISTKCQLGSRHHLEHHLDKFSFFLFVER